MNINKIYYNNHPINIYVLLNICKMVVPACAGKIPNIFKSLSIFENIASLNI